MGKRKFTAEQAREALLSTGLEMLESVGPAGVATVSLAEAINRSGVPRPSAYRVFGGGELDPQGAFQEQLVLRVIELEPGMDYSLLEEAVAPLMAEANDADRQPSADELTELLLEVLRQSARQVINFMVENPKSGVHLSAMALIRTGSDSDRIEAAVQEHREAMGTRYAAFYRDLLSAFGLRLRPGWTDSDIFTVFNDATIGAVMAVKGSTGTVQPVSWLAATYVALTALATEPDPRRVVSAQPLSLMSVSPEALLESV
ncbi:MAG: hypothetical protein AAF567_19445 [Actinomycetota bacterium]